MKNPEIVSTFRSAVTAGDKKTADRMRSLIIEMNRPLVRKFTERFARPQNEADREDAMQAGCMGLLRALEDYEPSKSSFSTYAAYWIRDHIQRWGGKPLTVNRSRSAAMPMAVAKAASVFRMKNGREPTAEELGVTQAQLDEWSIGTHFVYLDQAEDDEHGCVEIAEDPREAEHAFEKMQLEAAWQEAIKGQSDRNKEIAEAVLWENETHSTVGERFGLSRGMVTQICVRFEDSMKKAIARATNPASSRPPLSVRGNYYVRKHLEKVAKVRGQK